ncbi:MAG: TRAP transporter small permease subunit [Gammaproteobacteria bacterium]|nr:MAG: TRAP transporter small permease subunit [Gammaproteobacteria bacterium]
MKSTKTQSPLLRPVRVLDAVTEKTGRAIAWLNLPMVVLTCVVVALRYLFNTGSIALQETVMYLHATVFMIGAAYTLKHNEHVRVDIFYQRFSPRTKALVDLLGTLLLLVPMMGFIATQSWDYVAASWAVHEVSYEASGLPFVYVLKSLILVMVVVMLLQASAEILRNFCRLMGLDVPADLPETEGP